MNSQWHNEFVALCALFPSGELNEEEWALLQAHLAYCDSCLVVFRHYEHLADNVMSQLNRSPTDRKSHHHRKTKWRVPAGMLAACALGVAGLIGFHFVRSKQLAARTKQSGGNSQQKHQQA